MAVKFEITPERQGHPTEDQWTTICVSTGIDSPIASPEDTRVEIDLRDDGPEGSGRFIASLDLSLSEAGELASILKILANPGGTHSSEDIVNAGLEH